MTDDLKHIISRCLKDDRRAQNMLYQMFYGYAMSISIRYVNNQEAAEEIVNESFFKVFKYLSKFDMTKDFKPWFARVVVNTSLTELNKNYLPELVAITKHEEEVQIEEDIISKISYDELIELIQSLSLAYRLVFNLYVLDGFKHEEIAEKLNISVGASKSNLSRAKQNLKELLYKLANSNHVRQHS